MSETPAPYDAHEPDRTFTVTLSARLAEQADEYAMVRDNGDTGAWLSRVCRRALDPEAANKEEYDNATRP